MFYILLVNLFALLALVFKTSRNFEYEYSILLTNLYVFALPLLTLVLLSKKKDLLSSLEKLNLKTSTLFLLACLLTPFFLAHLLFYLTQCPCLEQELQIWFFVNVFPSIMYAVSVSFLLMYLKSRNVHMKFFLMGLCAFYIIGLFSFVKTLWTNPQKRVVDFLLGFIHGPIYDSWIDIDFGVVFMRSAHFFLMMALFYAVMYKWKHSSKIPSYTSLLLYFVFFYLAKFYPSTSHGLNALTQSLDQVIEHEDFVIHYQNPDDELDIVDSAKNLAIESEFHLSEIKKQLNLSSVPKFHIFAYRNFKEKKILFGGGQTDIADVYSPSIHILLKKNNYPTLRHEIVHVASSDLAYFGLGFHPNMAFTEGLAVAMAPEFHELDIHSSARAIVQSAGVHLREDLFTVNFWAISGQKAYTVAGSFLKYLLAQYGPQKVLAFYGGSHFETTFGQSLAELDESWQRYLKQETSLDKTHRVYTQKLYRRPGVLFDRCPHSRATLRIKKNVKDALLSFRQPTNWNVRENYITWLKTVFPESQSIQLKWTVQSIQEQFFASDDSTHAKWSEYERLLEGQFKTPFETLDDVESALYLSDFLSKTKPEKSQNILDEIAEFSKTTYIGQGLLRGLYVRQKLAQIVSSQDLVAWKLYLSGWKSLEHIDLELSKEQREHWLLVYLRVKSQRDVRWLGSDAMKRAFGLNIPNDIPNELRVEWYSFLAKRFLAHQEFLLAQEAFDKASRISLPGKKERLRQLSRMSLFYHDNI